MTLDNNTIRGVEPGEELVARGCPLVEELSPAPSADDVFARLSGLPNCLFLDSALRHDELGRYSFIMADPFDFLTIGSGKKKDALDHLQQSLTPFPAETINGLPPFQGGAAGLWSYELARQFENIPAAKWDEFPMPVMAIGLYDVVVMFDHRHDSAWIISHGFPERDPNRRTNRAARRMAYFRDLLQSKFSDQPSHNSGQQINIGQLAPQTEIANHPGLFSNCSPPDYLKMIERAIEYIYAGDIFQVNLAQRLLHPATCDSVSLYRNLRRINPATFAAYFDLGDRQILSASPERFLRVNRSEVETRPIKGTRPRTSRPEADLYAAGDLHLSEKDRAENIMIVDLLRNDLSRVCRPESVRVRQLCELEKYEYVQHLVSVVLGELAESRTPVDLLRAALPGGSITGAPKVRAMEIIPTLEPTARGAYCGSLGYLGFDGSLDTSILIRTITAAGGWWQAPVGGGIVAQSKPAEEYEETWHKAEGLIRAMM